MSVVIITGAAGLIGSQAAQHFCGKHSKVVGIDNNMREAFFGPGASTDWKRDSLLRDYSNYVHLNVDIRDVKAIEDLFREYGADIDLIVHTAAQPSHDWAAKDPHTDFTVNANGTLTLLEATRQFAPQAVFIFTSTNKVYGDRPNELPLVEMETRWEIETSHQFHEGIDESMSIDMTRHSLFGASKVAADVLVQEYGRYFGMKTASFRGGCLTGPNHSGTELHGFLSYLMKCVMTGQPYTVYGYQGKQVRDNIHSRDLIGAFDEFYRAPRVGEVYNIGGGRFCNCSMIEAISVSEEIAGKKLNWTYSDNNRLGDHIWWISDTRKFENHFPDWRLQYDLRAILSQIYESNSERWI
jgi:CDP-paratose 2-epimerase